MIEIIYWGPHTWLITSRKWSRSNRNRLPQSLPVNCDPIWFQELIYYRYSIFFLVKQKCRNHRNSRVIKQIHHFSNLCISRFIFQLKMNRTIIYIYIVLYELFFGLQQHARQGRIEFWHLKRSVQLRRNDQCL